MLARNLIDTSTVITSALYTYLATQPVTNIGLPTQRGRTARTGGAAPLGTAGLGNLSADVLSQKTASMMAITRHNLHLAIATWAPALYSDVYITITYNPGAVAAFNPTGLDALDVDTEADFRCLRNSVYYFPRRTDIRASQFTIVDATNPDGFLEFNKWWLGEYHELKYDPPFGNLDSTYMDASVQGRADDGTMYVDKKWKARRIVLRLDFIDDVADLAWLLAAARYLGKDKECWLDVYPDDTGPKGLYHRGAFRLVDSPTFNPVQVGLHKNTMTFEET
jgi:hypothetical protein